MTLKLISGLQTNPLGSGVCGCVYVSYFKAVSKQLNAKALHFCFLCFWCQKGLYLYENVSDFTLSTAQDAHGQLDLHQPDDWSRTQGSRMQGSLLKASHKHHHQAQFYKEELEVLYSSSTTFAYRAGRLWGMCYFYIPLSFGVSAVSVTKNHCMGKHMEIDDTPP